MTGKTRIPARDRRALLIGAGAVALLLAIRGVPALSGAAIRTAAEAQLVADRLSNARRLIDAMPAMRDSLQQRSARLQLLRPTLLKPATASRLSSDLSDLVAGGARDAGLVVIATSADADTASTTPLARAEVRLDAEGDISGVMQFLLLLELAPGMVRVLDLALSQAEPDAPATRAERLRLTATVEGVALRADNSRAQAGSSP